MAVEESTQQEFWVSAVDKISMLFAEHYTPDPEDEEEHIYFSLDQGITTYGASGPLPFEEPYTDSIPPSASGVQYNCFKVVEPT